MRTKFFTLLIAATALLMGSVDVSAKLDKGFIEKTSKEVWAMDMPAFNPKADLSDSLYANESAVFIAVAHKLVADHYNERDMSKYAEFGISRANAIDLSYLRRYMVKLNDSKAVEDFGDFTFDPPSEASLGLYNLAKLKYAFGARIHYPDGTVKDVDISDAFAVETGKKNKVEEYKIAIKGLEPGCVLEYYYLDDSHLEEIDANPINIKMMHRYPVKVFTVECSIATPLTLEYRAFNGAPLLKPSGNRDNHYNIGISIRDLEKSPNLRYISETRQYPFLKMRVKNNLSQIRRYYPSRRQTGIYSNVDIDKIYTDGAWWLSTAQISQTLFNKANGYLKDWKKLHPDADDNQIAEAALIASRLAMMTAGKEYSSLALTCLYIDLLRKHKILLPSSAGLVSSRFDIPLDKITSHTDPELVSLVGDRFYFTDLARLYMQPGEIPGSMDGEPVLMYAGKRDNYPSTNREKVTMPTLRPKDNTVTTSVELTLNPDTPELADANISMHAIGSKKASVAKPLNNDEVLYCMEAYLGIPEKNRHKPQLSPNKALQERKEDLEEMSEDFFTGEMTDFSDFTLKSAGFSPDQKAIEYSYKAIAHDVAEPDGDDLVVKIGKLLDKSVELDDDDRAKRSISVILPGAQIARYNILINIPEGYEVDADELAALSSNVASRASSFFSEAKLTDDGRISLVVQNRYPQSVIDASLWDDFVKALDAKAAFTNSTLTLRRK